MIKAIINVPAIEMTMTIARINGVIVLLFAIAAMLVHLRKL